MTDPIEERVAAIERRLDAGAPTTEESNVEDRLSSLEARLAEVEAAIEAIEAYVGHVERTDDDLERRADAALAVVEDLEARVEALEEPGATDGSSLRRGPDELLSHDPVPRITTPSGRHDESSQGGSGQDSLEGERSQSSRWHDSDRAETAPLESDGGASAVAGSHDTASGPSGRCGDGVWAGFDRDVAADERGLVARLRERL